MASGGEQDLVSSLFEAMIGGAIAFDAAGLVTRVNDAALEVMAASREECVGKALSELPFRISGADGRFLPVSEYLTARVLETGEHLPQISECMHRRDGSTRDILVQARPMRGAAGAVTGVVVSFIDITERARAERELRRSEETWRLLARHVPDIIIVLDLEARIEFVNHAEGSGPSQILGQHAWLFVDEGLRDDWRAHFEDSKKRAETVRFHTAGIRDVSGGHSFYETTLVPVLGEGRAIERFVLVVRDVTERRALMARIAEQDRRTGVGLLAASVAHEILNPLTYVLANIEFALRDPGTDPDRLRSALRDAREGALRMKQVVNDLRILGRGRDERLYVDVRSVLESAIRLAGPALSNATVQVDLPDVPPVRASESQLCQVALNLLVNAGHALRTRSEPREVCVVARSLPDTDEVSVLVADNGHGIPERLRERIFDPFFSTKEEGTGLGLSLARDVITRLGGRIEVASEEGRGATFTVYLPTTDRRPSDPPAARA